MKNIEMRISQNIFGQAVWIWVQHTGMNQHVYLRRKFHLESDCMRAWLRITADNHYQFYINGSYVSQGPARCQPVNQSYDEVEITDFLKRGENVFAVHAYHYGASTFQSVDSGLGGVLICGEISCTDNSILAMQSGSEWRAIEASAFKTDTARTSIQTGFQEDFCAEMEDCEWNASDFDDSHWPSACVVSDIESRRWKNFEPRGIPLLLKEQGEFKKVVGCFVGKNCPGWRDYENLGLVHYLEKRYADNSRIVNPQNVLHHGLTPVTVKAGESNQFAAMILDCGSESAAHVNFDVEATGGEVLDFLYFEMIDASGEPVFADPQIGCRISMADRYRCRHGRQTHEFMNWRGFRYVLVVFRNVKKQLLLYHIDLKHTHYPVSLKGNFKCSDELLNQIWHTGVKTLQLCMHDAYVDGPWREQAQWWGDARVLGLINYYTFGDKLLFKRGLRQAAQSRHSSGLIRGVFPTDSNTVVLPDYNLTWVSSLWEYYWYTGDDEPMREWFGTLQEILLWFESHSGDSGLCGNPGKGYWFFIDWAELDKSDRNATFTLQYLETLKNAANVAEHLGFENAQIKYIRRLELVKASVEKTFWDSEQRCFLEGYDRTRDTKLSQVSQHANSLAILLDIIPHFNRKIAEDVLIRSIHAHMALSKTGQQKNTVGSNIILASPFFYAFVIEALFKAGFGSEAIDCIRVLWGQMLAKGASTWFEMWPKDFKNGMTSACHAWSASPTYHLSQKIGGIYPASPGFKHVRISPQMANLEFAEVAMPTMWGQVKVNWQKIKPTKMLVEIDMPKPIVGEFEFGSRRVLLKSGRNEYKLEL
ncbi:MAG: alpha-L-rhamnosidase-related protein [Sedimentisphaerales bacterium]